MSNLLKKFVVSFLAFIVLFTSIAPNFLLVKAQDAPAEGTWYNQSFDQWYNKVYDENTSPGSEIFGERYTAAQVQWVIYSMFSFVINASLGNSSTSQKAVACFITNSANIESCIDPLKALIIGNVEDQQPTASNVPDKNLLRMVFADRPLSGITYVKERIRKFKLVPEVYAQSTGPGFGFDALKPMQDMWKGARDVAFGLFVIVAVVFAFMIMFRIKISPQVVISIQSAIPKIIIALILVTFSYAIAGFLVDLMYVVIGIFSLILPTFMPGSGMSATRAFGVMTGVPAGTNNSGGVFGLIGFGGSYLISFVVALIFVLAQTVSGVLVLLGTIVGAVIPGLNGVLLLLLIIIVVIGVILCLWFMIRAVWMLVKTFANIILLTIFAPLHITFGTFVPTLGFGPWIKSYISNLATFVGAGLMMFLAMVFLYQSYIAMGVDSPGFWLHVLLGPLGNPSTSSPSPYWPPLLGGGNSSSTTALLFLMVSFVMFTLIPKVSDIIRSLMEGKPFSYGSAIGETFGPPKALGTGALSVGMSKQETAAKAHDTSPYLYGSTRDRAVYMIQSALRSLLSGR